MKQELLDKYNVPVPRYTSYPPANYFQEGFCNKEYTKIIRESNHQKPAELSFYFHIPFCRRLCHYCGCNSYPVSTQDIIDRYVSALHKEVEMVTSMLDPQRKIAQIHYGGGTPTILPASDLKALNERLLHKFRTIENPEIALECHPGWLSEKDWNEISEAGFNRFSLGIQDFNRKVLDTVNRQYSLMNEEELVKMLHGFGARVNMDFLYGLPNQTEKSFTETIIRAAAIKPDRLVTFSYAHVPWAFPRQQVLEKAGLPLSDEKSKMYESARHILCKAGYEPIGLDHFVRKDDELYTALQNGKLHRNFQGYCTRRTTGQVYAFGVTGISQLCTAYTQNTKDIMEYIEKIEAGILPVAKGYTLTVEEQVTREVIEILMCNYRIDWQELSEHLSMPVDTIKQATAYNEAKLSEFANDGIIEYDANHIEITQEGTLFVRNIAASLDKLMLKTNKSFSKPV
ncbi:oxygen-independent coproporphyrinogen III oxidase [Parabacteroides bouchesdurhonensis]|uniref:oxygen-independent coproporphyrinogen III oxidase n=1 Tax=Parabacteroides bouchesdurhonensis TaxID=1936995 RepID=UPI000C84E7A1|nr:oxygen-independent coproporphyrinogen III oxidase [Parabacteroides bouchesdurhonensis]